MTPERINELYKSAIINISFPAGGKYLVEMRDELLRLSSPDSVTISTVEYDGLKMLECACNRAVSIRNTPILPIISEALEALDHARTPLPEDLKPMFDRAVEEVEKKARE